MTTRTAMDGPAPNRVRLLVVTPVFHPAVGFGGPMVFSKVLCESLTEGGVPEVSVLTTCWGLPADQAVSHEPRDPLAEKVRFAGFRVFRDMSLELLVRLPGAVRWADIVQIHSLFSLTSLAALVVAGLAAKPVVLIPHGQLQTYGLSHRRWLKGLWIWLAKWGCRPGRLVIRAASRDELIRNRDIFPHPAHVLIENGVRVPSDLAAQPRGSGHRLIFLGRLDAVKQIEVLFPALCLLPPDFSLDIHGSGEARYEASLKMLSDALGLADRVTFHGWTNDTAKSRAFSAASVLVIPSRSESFGQVVIEALAHGIPVVASQGTPWRELDERGCGFWVADRPEAIASACEKAVALDRAALRARARTWVRESYSADAIAGKFSALYQSLLSPEVSENASIQVLRRPARICIVSSCGGHLSEIRSLSRSYAALPHVFVLNDRIVPPPEMRGRTCFIRHGERDPWLLWNLFEMTRILWRERPDILLSSGAGPIVPAAIIGRYLFGCRVIYVETLARKRAPSLTGRIMRRLAHDLIYQWPELKEHFPGGILVEPFG